MAKQMEEQMDFFEDGGLLDEGGMVDEESGNEVPTGSLREEVRDDIPAQLSEGEFVFPADVVRFYGLEKLMEMRQRAKSGLQIMEDMGQMGNSEEATLPDDIPFDLEDLDIEEEDEYNMAVGGFVQPQAGYGTTVMQPTPLPTQPSLFSNYTQQPATQPVFQPQPVQAPQQFTAPTYTAPTYTGPTFKQLLPTTTGQYDEMKTYVNATGEERVIPFVNGQPIYPIPEGFTLKEEAAKVEEQAPTDVTTKTTRVTDRGGRDGEDSRYGGATISLGGTSKNGLIQGGTTYGLMFDEFTMGALTNMGLMGLGRSLLGKEPMSLPEGTSATIVDRKTGSKVSIPSSVYNEIRNNLTGATAKEVRNIIEKVNDFKSVGATNEDLNDAWATEQAKNLANKLSVKEAQRTGKWDAVINNAIKEAEAMVAADDDEAFSPVTGGGKAKTSTTTTTTSSAQKARENSQRDNRGRDGGGGAAGAATGPGSGASTSAGSGWGGMARGGLANKKTKPKQMKRGGLASKK